MPRGGKRIGAGRPKGATKHAEALFIGAEIDMRIKNLLSEMVKATASARTAFQAVEWAKSAAIPPSERAKWLTGAAGRDYLDDVEFARQSDHGVNGEVDTPQILHIEERLPRGALGRIEAEVAVRHGISARTARRYRHLYAAWVREIDDEDGDHLIVGHE